MSICFSVFEQNMYGNVFMLTLRKKRVKIRPQAKKINQQFLLKTNWGTAVHKLCLKYPVRKKESSVKKQAFLTESPCLSCPSWHHQKPPSQ